ncbi:MAG: nucleotidyltransferase substrate binding protein [Synergistaceae bacterium]|nr:nucleotidyltransferase substrate binding protein [Synergistaceae bacterium]
MMRPDAQEASVSAGARGCAAFPSADVPEGVAEDVRRIAEAHGVERVVLFGSRARGMNGPRSDVDLAVWGPGPGAFAEALEEEAWKVLKEILRHEGVPMESASPREVLKAAYRHLGILDEDAWLSMLRDRDDGAHVYDGAAARALAERIVADHVPAFERLGAVIEARYTDALREVP